jgi:phospholipid/cholesterol/gamma-HCH transport system permease protein
MSAPALPVTTLVGLRGAGLSDFQQLKQFRADSFHRQYPMGISFRSMNWGRCWLRSDRGRSGSAITAQIGVMRVTEELDAMRVMGIATAW